MARTTAKKWEMGSFQISLRGSVPASCARCFVKTQQVFFELVNAYLLRKIEELKPVCEFSVTDFGASVRCCINRSAYFTVYTIPETRTSKRFTAFKWMGWKSLSGKRKECILGVPFLASFPANESRNYFGAFELKGCRNVAESKTR